MKSSQENIFESAWRTFEEKYYYEKAQRYILREKRAEKLPFFVHTMGKVGSSTIRRSLRLSDIGDSSAVYGTYFLSPNGVKYFRELEDNGFGRWGRFIRPVKNLLSEARVLSEQLANSQIYQGRVKVISITRDPVATNISGFFQNNFWWPDDFKKRCMSGTDSSIINELIDHFMQDYPHSVPVDWWDKELKDVFGVDVLAEPFPKDKGYEIYQSDMADVLVLKLEKTNECYKQAFREFIGIQNFELVRANDATDKWYAKTYKNFINKISLPVTYLDDLYQSTVYQNFYTQEELDNFKSKWLR